MLKGSVGKKQIVLIGGGGHCKSVIDTVLRMGIYMDIFITDPTLPKGKHILGCRVAGDDHMLLKLYESGVTQAFLAVGSIKETDLRRNIFERAQKIGFTFPAIIDPSSIIAESAKIGKGVFIGKRAVVNAEAMIDDFAIINTGAIIEHGCYVGGFSHVAVGSTICGGVTIENDTLIGAGTTIIQGVKVGANCIIGAGNLVLRDVASGTILYRNGQEKRK